MSKKSELMLALWPNTDNRKYWRSEDASRSFWLSLRSVEVERTDSVFDGENWSEPTQHINLNMYETDGVACRNVGLWVWASTGFSSSIELKAHDVYSASAWELTQLAKWLTKMNNKIAKADIPDSFGVKEKLILTLRAMGIKRCVEIDPDWRKPEQYKLHTLEEGLALPSYADPLQDMEELRKQEWRSVA